ncbi:conserved Plasmodium protein, unknown function [Plasmodium ovale]|nr:conserved Plasmodium protein, unknown function [Plasmodium ovale curtisi]SCQ16898.1 conserved Plasmodium protein, unknown function [Plasmodium ovale]
MNLEQCVNFLKENFENLEVNEIEERVNTHLRDKIQSYCENDKDKATQIDDSTLMELMEVLSTNGEQKGDIKMQLPTEKRENTTIAYSTYPVNSYNKAETYLSSDGNNNVEEYDQSDLHKRKRYYENTQGGNECTEESRFGGVSSGSVVDQHHARMSQGDAANIADKRDDTDKDSSGNIASETVLEIIFRKSLLENENVKRNITSKNFYIIGEDMLVNITIILDRIILQLNNHYREKKIETDKQEIHFENFFKVLYKLLSNISFYSKEEKYKTIKLSNIQVKNSFLTNEHIFNLVKLLFEILNFNTHFGKKLEEGGGKKGIGRGGGGEEGREEEGEKEGETEGEEEDEEEGEYVNNDEIQLDNLSLYDNMIWKFDNNFTDKESILFDFVLSSVNIIMNMVNKKIPKLKCSNEKIHKMENKSEHVHNMGSTKMLSQEHKKSVEHLANNITPVNSKILSIHQKNMKEKQALNDIRKLHNEKYNVHKNYGKNSNNDNKIYWANPSNSKNNKNKMSFGKEKKNEHCEGNSPISDGELQEKGNLKKGKKKIKKFFKNLFKTG